jgi:hypothetical protein
MCVNYTHVRLADGMRATHPQDVEAEFPHLLCEQSSFITVFQEGSDLLGAPLSADELPL